jgi:hypothetical protein
MHITSGPEEEGLHGVHRQLLSSPKEEEGLHGVHN